MDSYIVWMVIGLVLVVVELATGTLHLLFLGVAAFAAAAIAYAALPLLYQVIAFAIVAAAALFWVQQHHKAKPTVATPPLELGQPVTFEQWIDAPNRLARVRYRGTLWDAEVASDSRGEAGEVLYIRAVNGQRLAIGAVLSPTR